MKMIGFVGLGTIGGAIAQNIQKAGYLLMVHDILREAVQPLVAGGARAAASAAEVAQHCQVVFTSLPGPREVEQVTLGPEGFCMDVMMAVSILLFLAAARTSYGASRASSACAVRES
jgi:3-hydroxyisobutyrate dehydrogenase-like beta-hydroxyacid dehydrogenase